jgi:chromosomal replication initiator protein
MKTCFQQPYGIVQIGCRYPIVAFRPPLDLTHNDLLKIISIHFSISLDELKGHSRKRKIVDIRRMAMHFLKTIFPTITLKKIGYYFSNMDHSTVIYSLKKFQDLIETEKDYLDQYLCLKAVIDKIISPDLVEN